MIFDPNKLPPANPQLARYEAEYYGAAALISQLAGVKYRRCPIPWFHGVHLGVAPSSGFYTREYHPKLRGKILTHREEQSNQLIQEGLPARAVGAPFLYTTPQGYSRIPNLSLIHISEPTRPY